MCILFIYLNSNASENEYKLILANNRDELYSRPTKSANFIESKQKIIAGIDLTAGRQGGTWLGASETGKIASLLNLMKEHVNLEAKSRGFLVMDYLMNNLTAEDYMKEIVNSGTLYDTFNLVALDTVPTEADSSNLKYQLSYLSNCDQRIRTFDSGVHGFGNTHIDTPLRKVEEGKTQYKQLLDDIGTTVEKEQELVEGIFKFMSNDEKYYPDAILSEKGKKYSDDMLQELSKIFLTSPHYGTRSTSIILVDGKGKMVFRERTLRAPTDSKTDWENNEYTLNVNKPT